MADEIYLPTLGEELSQGDIVDVLPVGVMAHPLEVIRHWQSGGGEYPQRKVTLYGHGAQAERFKNPPAPPTFRQKNNAPEFTNSKATLKRCVILSDDCVALAKAANKGVEFQDAMTEKAKNSPWHVAPVEKWFSDGETVRVGDKVEKVGDLVRQGKVKRYFPLPACASMSESYIDLRYVTALEPSLFSNVQRVLSMNELGKAYLTMAVYTYFSGRIMRPSFACPSCKTEVRFKDIDWEAEPGGVEASARKIGA